MSTVIKLLARVPLWLLIAVLAVIVIASEIAWIAWLRS